MAKSKVVSKKIASKKERLKILVCNDDSVHAPALQVLSRELKKMGDVYVVAPLEEKSTTGHSLTLHKPLRILELSNGFYGVSGSPADCIYVAIQQILKMKPDLVVSGINRGANLGQDVYYSGTVSAAREAVILGIPALAVSTVVDFKSRQPDSTIHFETAAKIVSDVLKIVPLHLLPKQTLLNVNVPDLPYRELKGFEITHQGFRHYNGAVVKRMDHRGKPYYWVGGQYKGFKNIEGSDCYAVDQKRVSITPVQLDCTDYSFIDDLNLIFGVAGA